MKRIIAVVLCLVLVMGVMPCTASAAGRDVALEESLAADLKSLGLFQGVTATDFALGRAPTRVEALVMLIRVLGVEAEAKTGDWKHPFSDVPSWADKYVGYAYEKGLTKGSSAAEFGTGNASAAMYLTFVLRALGYSDTNGADFTWSDPYTLARSVGILPERVDTVNFLRADVVSVSYAALPVYVKNSDTSLAARLIAVGAFTASQYDAVYKADAFAPETKTALTAKEIYAKCASSVFRIDTFDADGDSYAQGSGFFVDSSGIAVTNCHVLENALSANVTLTNGETRAVEGVIYFDDVLDYAVIKVEGSGYAALEAGDSSKLEGGETVYAIGNPQGLTNTISNGIVSNPHRDDLGGMIQITAAISAGGSGGALINEYGEAVGVTTATLESGQNLNFAVPVNEVKDDAGFAGALKNYGMATLAEYADFVAHAAYENLPDVLEWQFGESEPNDTLEYSEILENGMTVWGAVDGDDVDVFLFYCNTPGAIDVTVFSKSQAKYLKDIVVAARPVYADNDRIVVSDYYTLSDGTAARELCCTALKAATYMVYIYSDSLCKSEGVETDYTFYLEFAPGVTDSANSTGASHTITK